MPHVFELFAPLDDPLDRLALESQIVAWRLEDERHRS